MSGININVTRDVFVSFKVGHLCGITDKEFTKVEVNLCEAFPFQRKQEARSVVFGE